MKTLIFKSYLISAIASCFVYSGTVAAAPLDLADEPLTLGALPDPNIMLLFDSSGSMNNIVVDNTGPVGNVYDENTTYLASCSSSNRVSGTVRLAISRDSSTLGYAIIRTGNSNSSHFDWGPNESGTGITGRTKKCFDPNTTYTTQGLYTTRTDNNPNVRYAGGYGNSRYSGNYLNWYFSNSDRSASDNFGTSGTPTQKPGTERRLIVAREAANVLVDNLTNTRMGLSRYNGSHGARILRGLADVDDLTLVGGNTHRQNLKNDIDNIGATDFTPLGESFSDIGRYFLEGYEEATLTLYPDAAVGDTPATSTSTASTLFSDTPVYASTATVPGTGTNSAIQYSCQASYLVALTDGEPSSDDDVNSNIRNYDVNDTNTGGSTQYMDDVALALYDIDLRPTGFPDNNDFKNNVTTYLIGFADDNLSSNPLLINTAYNGSGGDKLAYFPDKAADLVAVFDEITSDIEAQTGSGSASSFNTASLTAGSAVFQPSFTSQSWNGDFRAFELDDTTGKVTDIEFWNAADQLDGQATRNIFTYSNNEGVRFEWIKLSTAQQDDLKSRWSSLTTDQQTAFGNDADAFGAAVLNYLSGSRFQESSNTDPVNTTDANSRIFRDRKSELGDIVNSSPAFVGNEAGQAWPEYVDDNRFGAAGKSYSDYVASPTVTSRTPILYVGANDGMLHGFNAKIPVNKDADGNFLKDGSGNLILPSGAGEEVIAYIPNALYDAAANTGLHHLADPDYEHRFYVDLSPVVSDVYVSRSNKSLSDIVSETVSTRDWRTILIGGLRAGGQGLFALDVSNPDEFAPTVVAAGATTAEIDANTLANEQRAKDLVLWEFTDADDSGLGYTYSTPTIAMTTKGWAAIVGNGYNSADGTAQLFVLLLEGGLDGVWTEGVDYFVIDTKEGNPTTPNGLSTPRVADTDGDSVANRVYAGDLEGNMWAFDISDSDVTQWKSAYIDSATTDPVPLFYASNDKSQEQPITSAPTLAINPNGNKTATDDSPNILVMFGTGRFVQESDIDDGIDGNDEVMSYYTVWDEGTSELTRSKLVERTLVTGTVNLENADGTATGETRTVRTVSSNTQADIKWQNTDPLVREFGWYMDLESNDGASTPSITAQGERVVSQSVLFGGILLFNTIIPDSAFCFNGGSGFLMSVDYDSGLIKSTGFFDANGDGSIDSDDAPYVGVAFNSGLPSSPSVLGKKRFTSGSESNNGKVKPEDDDLNPDSEDKVGRLSWEEMLPN